MHLQMMLSIRAVVGGDVPPLWLLGSHPISADQGGPLYNHKAGEQEE